MRKPAARRTVSGLVLIAGALLLAPLAATADEAAESPKLVTAPEPFRYCVTCHGVELQGNGLVDAPRLAGLPRWDLERQM